MSHLQFMGYKIQHAPLGCIDIAWTQGFLPWIHAIYLIHPPWVCSNCCCFPIFCDPWMGKQVRLTVLNTPHRLLSHVGGCIHFPMWEGWGLGILFCLEKLVMARLSLRDLIFFWETEEVPNLVEAVIADNISYAKEFVWAFQFIMSHTVPRVCMGGLAGFAGKPDQHSGLFLKPVDPTLLA